jgi:L-ascorbate metabolism protein UlaG (beta-lactamase superfamily)
MIITYYGYQFFKVQFGDVVLALDPVSKKSKLKTAKFGADIVAVSTQHDDFNGFDQIGYGDKQPFVVYGPGEYEIKDVFIKGFQVESEYDKKRRLNTIYKISLEGMNICFLGAINSDNLDSEILQSIGEVDILFVPIDSLSAAKAYKLAVKLEPSIVIPMQYAETSKEIANFVKEGGDTKIKPVDKLTLKKKDLVDKDAEIILLSPSS